jgi:CBS domain-containing protein
MPEAVVRDIMTSKLVTMEGNRTVLEGARLMNEKGISPLIDTKAGEPVGIVIELDIVEKVFMKELLASKVDIEEDITSRPLVTVDPGSHIDIAVQRMANRKIRRMPVAKNGKLAGMITVADLATYLRKTVLLEGIMSVLGD